MMKILSPSGDAPAVMQNDCSEVLKDWYLLQQVIISALVAFPVALTTSLVAAYVAIRGQKIQERNNSISSKLDFLNKKLEILEKIKKEILDAEIEESPGKQELMVEAGNRTQAIYFKRMNQIQSIRHYFDEGILDEISKNRGEIIDYFAQLKILASKAEKLAISSEESNLLLENQPWGKMVKEINDIESIITDELKETISQINKLIEI